MTWRCEGVRFRYPGATRWAVDRVSLSIPPGTCTAVLGPNGSGKSTLLRLLLGTLKAQAGQVWLGERPIKSWRRAEIARVVGVVPQSEEITFPLTVRELVAMGRYPYLGAWKQESPADRQAIEAAMRRCDVVDFADREVPTLSGGERQRARVARALAQEPSVLALDEPTLALDIRHEMEIFELIRDLRGNGVTVLLITHNLNLAARYADRLIVMAEGHLQAEGPPASVLTRELVERVYRWPVQITPFPGPGSDRGAPQVVPLSGESGTPDCSLEYSYTNSAGSIHASSKETR